MVEAPEKIWLSAPDEVWFEDSEGRTEYTRSDIAERQIAELRAEYLNASKDAIELAGKLNAAEAENARLRALPLKDEVERLTYGQKLIAEAIEHHFGERTEDYDEDADDTTNRDAWEAFDALLSRLRAGEQEGWQELRIAFEAAKYVPGDHPIVPVKIDTFMKTVERLLAAAPSEQGGDRG